MQHHVYQSPVQAIICLPAGALTGYPLLWTPSGVGSWLMPHQALIPDDACKRNEDLSALLLADGLPLAQGLPAAVERCLLKVTPGVRVMSPGHVRQHFTRPGSSHPSLQEQLASGQLPAAVLLEYCLSDVLSHSQPVDPAPSGSSGILRRTGSGSSKDPSGQQQLLLQQRLQQLHLLPLLPLADGTTGTLEATPAQQRRATFYLASGSQEQQLLQAVQYQLVHPGCSAQLQGQLQQVANTGLVNVEIVSGTALDKCLLQEVLPYSWHKKRLVEWDYSLGGAEAGDGSASRQPSRVWVQGMWEWLSSSRLAVPQEWPLVPVRGGKLCSTASPIQVRVHACCCIAPCRFTIHARRPGKDACDAVLTSVPAACQQQLNLWLRH
jgi:hypothetical protein